MAMALCQFLVALAAILPASLAQYSVSGSPGNVSAVLDGFVSYSIEFVFFPDYAGNSSTPNTFSDNLLQNIGDLIGKRPYIRVGGNTQDYALYNASLPVATYGIYNLARSADYPTTVYIGPSYFDSYSTWNNTKFSHGLNMGLGGNNSEGWQTLLDTVPLACKALGKDKLYWWEYGNEPDLYSTSSQGPVRPPNWNESTYVQQWLNGTREIKSLLQEACPDLAGDAYGFLAPSFAGTNNHLKVPVAWQDGLDVDGDIKLFSSHNYINGATSPGVTLQGTLMNHTETMQSVNAHVVEYNTIVANSNASVPPHIFGETNSLYNEGKPGLSNSFGAALWGIDFNLYCASVGIRRVHMHMGTDYRYASWQPVATNKTAIGTKPPYYGNVAIAAMLASSATSAVSIAQIPLSQDQAAAYAAYVDNHLTRLIVISLEAYNYTLNGTGPGLNPDPRPSSNYTFSIPAGLAGSALVQRLYANGSDALSGITFDGWSYNYELANGKPVRLSNVTVGETLEVTDGKVEVEVEASTAVILNLIAPASSSGAAKV